MPSRTTEPASCSPFTPLPGNGSTINNGLYGDTKLTYQITSDGELRDVFDGNRPQQRRWISSEPAIGANKWLAAFAVVATAVIVLKSPTTHNYEPPERVSWPHMPLGTAGGSGLNRATRYQRQSAAGLVGQQPLGAGSWQRERTESGAIDW